MESVFTVREITSLPPSEWNKRIAHPMQSWEWGDFRKSMGIDVVRLGLFSNGIMKEGWQIFFHRIPHLPFTIAYFPKGPAPTKFMLSEIFREAKRHRAIYVLFEPNTREGTFKATALHRQLRKSTRPLFTEYTFILDLSAKTEDELLAGMHPKTRYNIRVAQKHGVTTENRNDDATFQEYLRLTEETTKRQQFYAHNTEYHKKNVGSYETLTG